MPLYEYACSECGLTFEVRQKFSDEPVRVCRVCGGPVAKLISQGGGFALKGGGWYQQGYAEPAGRCDSTAGAGCAGCPKAANE
ncbi:MAG TPA: zinc ribbon domain-containing protein [Geopsychrobacteraceae bacterium]|jgi:putative FmdB family regulatory protein